METYYTQRIRGRMPSQADWCKSTRYFRGSLAIEQDRKVKAAARRKERYLYLEEDMTEESQSEDSDSLDDEFAWASVGDILKKFDYDYCEREFHLARIEEHLAESSNTYKFMVDNYQQIGEYRIDRLVQLTTVAYYLQKELLHWRETRKNLRAFVSAVYPEAMEELRAEYHNLRSRPTKRLRT